MALAPTSFNAVLKEDYSGQALEQILYEDYPFLKMCQKRKNTRFEGKYHPVPVNYSPAGGVAGVFTDAQGQAGVNQDTSVSFFIPAVLFYANTQIPGQVIKASRTSGGAFMDVITKRMEDSLSLISARMASQLWRSGYGYLGTVASVTSTTITLTDVSEAVNFQPGATFVDAGATLTGAAYTRQSTIPYGLQVTAVDQNLGVLTVAVNPTTAFTTAVAAGNILFGAGDHSTTPSIMIGLEGICPVTAPVVGGGDDFYGVDRSVSRQLTGTSYNALTSGAPIDQVLIAATNRASQAIEGRISHYFMNLDWYTQLENALGTKVRYGERDLISNPEFGTLEGIRLNHPRGEVLCVADKSCPPGRIFGVNEEDCIIYQMEDGFEPWDEDGQVMLRVPGADSVEIRFNGYQNFFVTKPNNVINIQVPVLG
jgi:hypothetical protein